jgi:hypothetical protein
LEELVKAIRQEKEIKVMLIGNADVKTKKTTGSYDNIIFVS